MSDGGLGPGVTLGDRYEVEAVLGEGAMGRVFRVLDTVLDEYVALKLLTWCSPRAIDRFRDEVRLARRVTHVNVARTHDLGRAGDQWFLTMELVSGTSLDGLLHDGRPLATRRALDVVRQVALGLQAAHAVGVVHRDLKPGNVLVEPGGRAVITDFGIAIDVDAGAQGTAGTPDWMAPEQLAREPVGVQSDLYSLGLLAFRLLTGRDAFPTPEARLAWGPPPDPADLAVVAPEVGGLVRSLLERDPAARPLHAGAVVEALGGVPAPGPGREVIAVGPLVWRGPPADAWQAEDLEERLLDTLADVHCVQAVSRGEVRWGVEGSVRAAEGEVTLRLVERATGARRWTETRALGDPAITARQLGEALRLHSGLLRLPQDDALVGLPDAWRQLQQGSLLGVDVLGAFERVLGVHDALAPAAAARAVIRARQLWRTEPTEGMRAARRDVDTALRVAPEWPETHVAAAMLAMQDGRLHEACLAGQHAHRLAPDAPLANAWLGELWAEVGDVEQSRLHLERVLLQHPAQHDALMTGARIEALVGSPDAALEMFRGVPRATYAVHVMHGRVAAWHGRLDEARLALERMGTFDPSSDRVRWLRMVIDGASPEVAHRTAAGIDWSALSPRLEGLVRQVVTEVLCALGDAAGALRYLTGAAETNLIDLLWLTHCPVLEPLRGSIGYDRAVARVQRRVASVRTSWGPGPGMLSVEDEPWSATRTRSRPG